MKTLATLTGAATLIVATINADQLPEWAFNLSIVFYAVTIAVAIITIEKKGR